ncbi:hypothetical protein [Bradyrhizobium betae]|uniref:hypothetical protein n=1 Tax=Bradyrhizobium betae TaxID=244734 RepID=UPI0013E91A15|nr:hypothetical protein [Bradyrhizobium betae]
MFEAAHQVMHAIRVQRQLTMGTMLWLHQLAKLAQLAARSHRQAPLADPQSLSRSWFGLRGAKSVLSQNMPWLDVRSGPSQSPRAVLWQLVEGDLEPTHPITVTFPASSEAIDALGNKEAFATSSAE